MLTASSFQDLNRVEKTVAIDALRSLARLSNWFNYRQRVSFERGSFTVLPLLSMPFIARLRHGPGAS